MHASGSLKILKLNPFKALGHAEETPSSSTDDDTKLIHHRTFPNFLAIRPITSIKGKRRHMDRLAMIYTLSLVVTWVCLLYINLLS